MYQCALVAIRC